MADGSYIDSRFAGLLADSAAAGGGVQPAMAPRPQQPQQPPQSPGILGQIGNAAQGALGGLLGLPGRYVGAIGSALADVPNAIGDQAQERKILLAQHEIAAQQAYSIYKMALAIPDPNQRMAALANLPEYGKALAQNVAPQEIAGGATKQFYGPGGPSETAPLLGMTKDGQGYTQTPNLTTATGALPTIQSAAPGTTVSPIAPAGVAAPSAPGLGGPPPAAAEAAAGAVDAHAPRGIRNNNWGNLTNLPNGQAWAGQTGSDGHYAVFATPQDGLKAAITNLQAYATHHGINTIAGIAQRWAPKSAGNDPGAYAKNIAGQMGVGVDQPLDMSNPTVLSGLVHGIAVAENGVKAVSQALAPGGTSAAQPSASTASPGPPTSIQGKTNTDIAPADAMAQGLGPGRWQITPTGEKVQISKPPAEDIKRIADLDTGLDTLHQLQQNQQAFLRLNAQAGTGLQYHDLNVHGHDVNPVSLLGIANNPAISQMHALAQSQVLMAKPANAGARILQSELPLWQEAVQGIDLAPDVNQARLIDTNRQLAYLSAKKGYLNTWLYHKGNLHGADESFNNWWAKSRYAQPSAVQGQAPQAPQAAAPAQGQVAGIPAGAPTATGPNGHKIFYDGTQWRPVQ